ncbi:hypothetical protein GpartN1_g1778.t1 [Galdieria partita]|uniref:Glycosyl transferase CAP10 domain-containing protein n=1 Tax=Galdieria partita TaxID=83374 RepID=A0A9C7PUS1_9RHOD|nr:hypothetical protein GpartN1_g1778.t1 [Galdieria partita]
MSKKFEMMYSKVKYLLISSTIAFTFLTLMLTLKTWYKLEHYTKNVTVDYDDSLFKEVEFRLGTCNLLRKWTKTGHKHLIEEIELFSNLYGEDFERVSNYTNIEDNVLEESCFLRHARRFNSPHGVLWPRRYYHFPDWFRNDTISWSDKNDTLFWRGSATGPILDEEEVTGKSNRRKIVELLQSFNRTDIDVGFIALFEKEEKYSHLRREPVPQEGMFQYKYVLNIEGNDLSSNFPQALFSWSCPFHPYPFSVESVYFRLLRPWEHFIPLQLDGSDTIEKLQFCKNNENFCRKVGENGRRMMEKFMNETFCHEVNRQVLVRLRNIPLQS